MNRFRCLVALVAALSAYGCGSEGGSGAGSDAATALISTSAEAEGDNCVAGGVRVDTGVDDDGDGALSDAEIDSTSFVCNGPVAAPGNPGSDGSDGMDGNPGVDGLTSLIATSEEPAGANCDFGGSKIESGVDDDGNGTLEATEVDQTEYICNGVDGISTLSRTTAEPAGPNCSNGGILFEVGLDADRSGALDDPEVNASQYVCNGENGAPGVAGADGTSGVDGPDGLQTLIQTSYEPFGDNCTQGGARIEWGLDDNADGTLDPAEIDGTDYLCAATPVSRWGNPVELGISRTNSPDNLRGIKVTVTEATKLRAFGVIGRNMANHKTGIYSDSGGNPDQLVAEIGPRNLTLGSQEVGINPVPIPAGDYWIMTVYETFGAMSGSFSFSSTSKSVPLPFSSPLPTTFPANPTEIATPEYNYWIVTAK